MLTLTSSLLLLVPPTLVRAQDDVPELSGTLAFNVGSRSGRVERLVVTIGDGGTGQYKAVLIGEASLPTHAIYGPRDLTPFLGRISFRLRRSPMADAETRQASSGTSYPILPRTGFW
jgi:hypothetical protein